MRGRTFPEDLVIVLVPGVSTRYNYPGTTTFPASCNQIVRWGPVELARALTLNSVPNARSFATRFHVGLQISARELRRFAPRSERFATRISQIMTSDTSIAPVPKSGCRNLKQYENNKQTA